MRPKILLTGCNGQVGWDLQRTLAPIGDIIPVDLPEVDFRDSSSLRVLVGDVKPDIIVNPAAYTAVDRAESEPDSAFAVNGDAPGALAGEAAKLRIPLVHYSTDYVFDGESTAPYCEEDETGPRSVYGESKLAGERAVQLSGADHVILRLAWVFAMRGSNFVLTMMRLARERSVLRVVNDQTGSPSWSRAIAAASALVVWRLIHERSTVPSGIYHLPSRGTATWFEFAEAIFENGAGGLLAQAPEVVPITTAEYPTPAHRPVNSVLSGEKIARQLRISLPSWQEQLAFALQDAQAVMDGVTQ